MKKIFLLQVVLIFAFFVLTKNTISKNDLLRIQSTSENNQKVDNYSVFNNNNINWNDESNYEESKKIANIFQTVRTKLSKNTNKANDQTENTNTSSSSQKTETSNTEIKNKDIVSSVVNNENNNTINKIDQSLNDNVSEANNEVLVLDNASNNATDFFEQRQPKTKIDFQPISTVNKTVDSGNNIAKANNTNTNHIEPINNIAKDLVDAPTNQTLHKIKNNNNSEIQKSLVRDLVSNLSTQNTVTINDVNIEKFKESKHSAMQASKSDNIYVVAIPKDNEQISDTKPNDTPSRDIQDKALNIDSKANLDNKAPSKYIITPKQVKARNMRAPDPLKRDYTLVDQVVPPNIAQKVYDQNNKHLVPVEFEYELTSAAFQNLHAENSVDIIKGIILKLKKTDFTDQYGNTLLIHAVSNKNYTLLSMLLANGANPNIKNYDGFSALHIAASYGYYSMVYKLIQYGADPNLLDVNGNTPLNYSTAIADISSVKLMLSFGAKVNIKNHNGITPLDIAKSNGNLDIYQHMVNHNRFVANNLSDSIDLTSR